MSISPPVGALNNYLAKLMSGRFYAAAQARAASAVLGDLAQARRRTRQGHGHAGHDVRGIRLQLHRADRRPRPRCAGADAEQHQRAEGAAVPACGHAQGPGLQAWPKPIRVLYHGVAKFDPDNGIVGGKSGGKPTYTQVFGDWLCDMAAHDKRLVGITPAMREGSGMVRFSEAISGALFRRRHRRAARADLCRGAGLRRLQAGGGDLFDLPAARLRPADPRRHDPEPAGGAGDRPRRAGRRRRRDPRRQLRSVLSALPAQHDGDGAGGRERMPPDAVSPRSR